MDTGTSVYLIKSGEHHIEGFPIGEWHYDEFSIYWVVNISKYKAYA